MGQPRPVLAPGQNGQDRIPLRLRQGGGIVPAVPRPSALGQNQLDVGVGHVVVGLGVIRFGLGRLDRRQYGFNGGQIIPSSQVHMAQCWFGPVGPGCTTRK